jgi:hypothetical protein
LDPSVTLVSLVPPTEPCADAPSVFVSGMIVVADPELDGSSLLFMLSILISTFKPLISAA